MSDLHALTIDTCRHGHPLTEDNIYRRESQPWRRDCRTCRRARATALNKGRDPRADETRFFSKVRQDGDCWLFSTLDRDGYGRFWVNDRNHGAHRWSYEFMVAEVPEGLQIDHLCRVRSCVNPAHLEPVTNRVNTLRGDTLPARNLLKTHCLHGHPFAGENLLMVGRFRRCKTCDSRRDAAYRARKAGA